jgi:hypothetical protein
MNARVPRPIWIAVPTVALLLAALGLQIATGVQRQQRVVREIKRLDGVIETRPFGPDWLRGFLGEERLEPLASATVVVIGGPDVNDAALATVCHLTTLDELYVGDDSPISDAGLKQIGGLRRLRYLKLRSTPVTDAGLTHLKVLTALEHLDLGFTQVTDHGLIALSGIKNLKELYLFGTDVSDEGLRHLAAISSLEDVDLDLTPITDRGLEHLKGLTRLRKLRVKETGVTDAGVADLKRALPELTVKK